MPHVVVAVDRDGADPEEQLEGSFAAPDLHAGDCGCEPEPSTRHPTHFGVPGQVARVLAKHH